MSAKGMNQKDDWSVSKGRLCSLPAARCVWSHQCLSVSVSLRSPGSSVGQSVGPSWELLTLYALAGGGEGAWECAFLTRSQGLLPPPVWELLPSGGQHSCTCLARLAVSGTGWLHPGEQRGHQSLVETSTWRPSWALLEDPGCLGRSFPKHV